MPVFAIEHPESKVLSLGYERRRDALDDVSNYDGAKLRTFDGATELRDAFPDEAWLETLTDDEIEEVA
jgi:hypothetical protein